MRRVVLLLTYGLFLRSAAAAPGVVVAPHAEARAAPRNSAPIVQKLVKGNPICMIGTAALADDWQMVTLADGMSAYLPNDDVILVSLAPTAANICIPSQAAAAVEYAASSPAMTLEPAPSASPLRRPVIGAVQPGRFLPLDPLRLSFGLASGAAWLNRASADQHRIGAAGPTFYLTLGVAIYEIVSVSASFGAVFPADHASFNQDVVPLLGGGAPSSAGSSLQITNYSIAIGPRTPLFVLAAKEGGAWVAGLFADYGWSRIAGDRFIENCNDCLREDLDLADGVFVRAGANIGAVKLRGSDGAFMLDLSYQQYLASAGIARELRAGFSLWFL